MASYSIIFCEFYFLKLAIVNETSQKYKVIYVK